MSRYLYPYDWGRNARQELMSCIRDADARRALEYNAGMAGVCGKTQVGKTTLILGLLGVKDEHKATVDRVLRGGRKQGNSATVLPSKYQRSDDENWHFELLTPQGISQKEQVAVSDTDAEKYLGGKRKSMETGSLQAEMRLNVKIPLQYFQSEHARVDVLDLPGFKPKDKNEADWVEKVLQHWLPRVDLLVLVAKSRDCAALEPIIADKAESRTEKIIAEKLRDSRRAHLVLTHAFETDDARRRLASADIVSVVQSAKDQLWKETCDGHDAQQRIETSIVDFYPAAYSRANHPIDTKNCQRIHVEINAETVERLRVQVAQASRPESWLGAIQHQGKRLREKSDELTKKLEQLNEEFNQCQSKAAIYKERVDAYNKQKKFVEERFTSACEKAMHAIFENSSVTDKDLTSHFGTNEATFHLIEKPALIGVENYFLERLRKVQENELGGSGGFFDGGDARSNVTFRAKNVYKEWIVRALESNGSKWSKRMKPGRMRKILEKIRWKKFDIDDARSCQKSVMRELSESVKSSARVAIRKIGIEKQGSLERLASRERKRLSVCEMELEQIRRNIGRTCRDLLSIESSVHRIRNAEQAFDKHHKMQRDILRSEFVRRPSISALLRLKVHLSTRKGGNA